MAETICCSCGRSISSCGTIWVSPCASSCAAPARSASTEISFEKWKYPPVTLTLGYQVELSCRFWALATSVPVAALFMALLLVLRIAAASSRERVRRFSRERVSGGSMANGSAWAASCNGASTVAARSPRTAALGIGLFIIPVFYGEIQSGRKIVEDGVIFVYVCRVLCKKCIIFVFLIFPKNCRELNN